MTTSDRVSNTIQDAKGKVKETTGRAVGNRDLEAEGKGDQAGSKIKDAGEDLKGAAAKVKKAVTP